MGEYVKILSKSKMYWEVILRRIHMIFVTLGTQDKPFQRLLDAIQKQIDNGTIKDEVIVQAGCTKFESKQMKLYDMMDIETFETYVKNCDLMIAHGGVGSILDALKQDKKVIAAPRLGKYGEAANDHQKQIIDEFSKEGYILALNNFNELDKVLKKAKKFKPRKYASKRMEFVNQLEHYIETGTLN